MSTPKKVKKIKAWAVVNKDFTPDFQMYFLTCYLTLLQAEGHIEDIAIDDAEDAKELKIIPVTITLS